MFSTKSMIARFAPSFICPISKRRPIRWTVVIRGDSDPLQFAPSVRPIIETSTRISRWRIWKPWRPNFCAGKFVTVCRLPGGGVWHSRAYPVGSRRLCIDGELRCRTAARNRNSHGPRGTKAECAPRRDGSRSGCHRRWIACGVLLALGLARLLSSLIYGVSAWDTETFVITPFLLALVALTATYFPARRTTSIDPMQTLRTE